MDSYFAPYGISGPQWAVLRMLYQAESEGDKALRLTDLGQRLVIQPPSVTGVIDRLERSALVARTASCTDLRAREVSLTSQGRELVVRILQGHGQQIRSLFSGLAPAEREGLRGLLGKLEMHLMDLASAKSRPGGKGSAAT
jgi:DNA-binding MarR family transcriptional regulator